MNDRWINGIRQELCACVHGSENDAVSCLRRQEYKTAE